MGHQRSPARSSASISSSDGVWHGFLLSNGTYTAINYPNATSTNVCGINDYGEITGQWSDSAGNHHGFYAVPQ